MLGKLSNRNLVLARITRLFRQTSVLVQVAHRVKMSFCSSGLPDKHVSTDATQNIVAMIPKFYLMDV